MYIASVRCTECIDCRCLKSTSAVIIVTSGVNVIRGCAQCRNVMKDIELDVVDIYELLEKLPATCASGPDGLPLIVFKKLSVVLAEPLSLIFKEILKIEAHSQAWKVAHVIPIHKNGSRADVGNYRPVSITCVMSRLLENTVADRIDRFLRMHSLIDDASLDLEGKNLSSYRNFLV